MKKLSLYFFLFVMVCSCNNNSSVFDASGMFEATEITVSAEASGKISSYIVTEGMKVSSVDLLGIIDTTQLSLKRQQLVANIDAVESRRVDVASQLEVLRQQIATQEREQERITKLVNANAANQKQLDDVKSNISLLNSQLTAQQKTLYSNNKSIQAEVKTLQAQLEMTNDQLIKSRIFSPIDGTVLTNYVHAGELTSMGQPLFKVADIDNMILRLYVTSAQMSELHIGQVVRVLTTFGEENSHEYEGTVTWISNKAEFTPKTIQTKDERENLVYAIKVAVKNDGYIKIGMYADAIF